MGLPTTGVQFEGMWATDIPQPLRQYFDCVDGGIVRLSEDHTHVEIELHRAGIIVGFVRQEVRISRPNQP
jgi:hypothetical protein